MHDNKNGDQHLIDPEMMVLDIVATYQETLKVFKSYDVLAGECICCYNSGLKFLFSRAFHQNFLLPRKTERFVPEKRINGLEMDNTEVVDVVGPICEGTDCFAKNRAMPTVKRGDLVAAFSTGAYGFTMASNYNTRPMCAEVLVDGDQFRIIRKRPTYEDLIELEK